DQERAEIRLCRARRGRLEGSADPALSGPLARPEVRRGRVPRRASQERARMKRGCLANILFIAILFVVFGASTYFWFNFFVRGTSLPTPNLIGKPVSQARAICGDLGVSLIVDP